ncbi:MAG TPA: helical backbone metal receptor [Vicinamibacterales bacterium]|nr:helical backbone metal receptor [Vicinamibacterales bacterium]
MQRTRSDPFRKLRAALCAIVAAAATILAVQAQRQPGTSPSAPHRIVCLIPNVTEILFAVGAGPQVVAVSSYDTYPPAVRSLPRVGALLDPDVERILSLRPDLVVAYGSQVDLTRQLARAHITVYPYRHGGIADLLRTTREIGVRTGHAAEGERVASRMERELDAVRARVRGRPRPRTLLVFGREPRALRGIYASGGTGFLNDMLTIAGGENVFANVRQESVQASTEVILAMRPDVVLEVRASDSAMPIGDLQAEIAVWNALPALPAVQHHRVRFLVDDRLVVPGPRIAQGTELMARALHPEAFQ